MKLNLKTATESICKKFHNVRYEKKQAEIAKHIDIEGVRQTNVYKDLCDASEIMANYAKAKGVKIKFNSFPEANYPSQAEELINLSVAGAKGEIGCILNITDKPTVVEKRVSSLLTNKDGLDYVYNGTHTVEDNFLRRVYRNIEDLTRRVQ